MFKPHENWSEYQAIFNYYGQRTTKRTAVLLIHHIDEGLMVLRAISASEDAQRAFCLHPMFQEDAELAKNGTWLRDITDGYCGFLAAEYRNVANDYLSPKVKIANGIPPKLSPLTDVNDMLIADKVQNRYEFEKNHLHTHSNRDILGIYFQQWFDVLGITERRYQELIALFPPR